MTTTRLGLCVLIAGLSGCADPPSASQGAVGQEGASDASAQQGECSSLTPPSPDVGCSLTQGYWKTHPQAWPVSSLSIGGVSYDQAALLALFNTPPSGDASLILAHQLIAAMLNVASGAAPASASTQAIADAQAWMAANLPAGGRLPYGIAATSPAGTTATALGSALDQFNNGAAGVPHCKDGPGSGGEDSQSCPESGGNSGGESGGDKPPPIGSGGPGGTGGGGGIDVL